jgi:hypothetical protein
VASLDWRLQGLLRSGAVGSRLGLTVDQLIPFLNHTVLGVEQAVGLEFLPSVRLMGDQTFTIPFGVGCNLNKAVANPTNFGAWEFGYYLDTSSLATLAARALAY